MNLILIGQMAKNASGSDGIDKSGGAGNAAATALAVLLGLGLTVGPYVGAGYGGAYLADDSDQVRELQKALRRQKTVGDIAGGAIGAGAGALIGNQAGHPLIGAALGLPAGAAITDVASGGPLYTAISGADSEE